MIYVVVQFCCIIYLIFNAQFTHFGEFSYILMAVAIVIAMVSVINMKLSNLNIRPQLKNQHKLRTGGIYKFIRHPMYVAILLFCLPLLLSNAHKIAQLSMLILTIDLVLKSHLEEKLLNQRFLNYSSYQQKTGRFLPFL